MFKGVWTPENSVKSTWTTQYCQHEHMAKLHNTFMLSHCKSFSISLNILSEILEFLVRCITPLGHLYCKPLDVASQIQNPNPSTFKSIPVMPTRSMDQKPGNDYNYTACLQERRYTVYCIVTSHVYCCIKPDSYLYDIPH